MRLTVGLPVYNGADYLSAALDSILSQEGADFELVVSEGGSTDATPAILRDYAARDARVRYLPTATRLSQVENCNRVLELARTEWVQFMCHDDILLPGALRKISETIARCPESTALLGHGAATLFNDRLAYDPAVNPPAILPWTPGSSPFGTSFASAKEICFSPRDAVTPVLSLRSGPPLPALTTAAVRRSALLAIGGFDPRYAQFDTRAWHRLLIRHDYAYLPAPLSLTRIHGAQVTAKLKNQLRTTMDALSFWPDYVEEAWAAGFAIPLSARWLPWLKAGSEAAIQIYVSANKSRWAAVRQIFWELPWRLKFLAPLLLLRVWRAERRRTATLRAFFSFRELYP